MKNRYEALLVLNTKGSDDSVKETLDRLENEFKADGAAIEQVQKMDKRQFAYAPGKIDSGYYVNFVFEGEPSIIEKLKSRFRLDNEVYYQHYQKLRAKKVATAS